MLGDHSSGTAERRSVAGQGGHSLKHRGAASVLGRRPESPGAWSRRYPAMLLLLVESDARREAARLRKPVIRRAVPSAGQSDAVRRGGRERRPGATAVICCPGWTLLRLAS
jgi:hypothetical protein